MSQIEQFNNECVICYTNNSNWHYHANKSHVEVFKYPMCRTPDQQYLKIYYARHDVQVLIS